MTNYFISACVGCIASLVVLGTVNRPAAGPTVINLEQPGDAITITLKGKAVGGLRVDGQGRLGIFGSNQSSTAVTIDGLDRVQINPAPLDSPPARLTIDNDVWLTGVLRVGRPDAFGDAPFDPNGAIQVGRNLPIAQPMALVRAFAQGREAFRLGTAADGSGYWSDGAHDVPLLTFQPSLERSPHSGKLIFQQTEIFTNDQGLTGRNLQSGSTTTIVPK